MGCILVNLEKIKRFMDIIRKLSIVFGLVLLVIIFTVGRTNESLQPTISMVVINYTYFIMLVLIINALVQYIDKRRTK